MNIYQILTIILSLVVIILVVLLFIIRKKHIFEIQVIEKQIDSLSLKKISLQEEKTKQQELFDLIIDSIPSGVVLLDEKLKIAKLNESIANLFYLDKTKAVASTTIFLFNNKNLEELINEAVLTLKPQQKKIVFYQDEDITLEVEAIPVEIKNFSTCLLFKNTTQEAEFSKLRSQFVANVSHEMRTPLTSIKGYIETLLENNSEDMALIKRYLFKAGEEVDRLSFLIEDVLDLSNIEYRRNIISKQEINIVKIIRDCIKSLNFLSEKNDVKIIFKPESDIIKFYAEEELFRQMVRNMIENTIFHAGKNIKLDILLENRASELVLNFKDNGVGIEKSDQPFIFQRFYRGTNLLSSKKIGSGLGLAIVKHIVELHSGSIVVTSAPGAGTMFSLTFPK